MMRKKNNHFNQITVLNEKLNLLKKCKFYNNGKKIIKDKVNASTSGVSKLFAKRANHMHCNCYNIIVT